MKDEKLISLDNLKARLKLVNVKAFSEFADVHPNSVYRMRDGTSESTVKHSTLKKVADALDRMGVSDEANK